MVKVAIIVIALACIPGAAFAANVSVTGNPPTLVLPVDNSTYSIAATTTFDSLVVNNASFVFTLPNGAGLTITSLDSSRLLTNSLGATTTCGSSQSSLALTNSSGLQQTVTITPGSSCGGSSNPPSNSGSNAVSAGGTFSGQSHVTASPASNAADAPKTIADLIRLLIAAGIVSPEKASSSLGEVAVPAVPSPSSPEAISSPNPAPTSAPGSVLAATDASGATAPLYSRDLGFDAVGPDVTALQKAFKLVPTGHYGSATKAAVISYQSANGLPATGYFGPLTRAMLVSLDGPKP